MLHYYYQIQLKRNGRWTMFFDYGSRDPFTTQSLEECMDKLKSIRSKHSDCRIMYVVK